MFGLAQIPMPEWRIRPSEGTEQVFGSEQEARGSLPRVRQ